MNRRWLTWIPGIAALACAAIMFFLIIQIDQTRKQLQNDGVLEFNFIQQLDHNFSAFAHSLTDYQLASPEQQAELHKLYIQRFDVLYGSIRHVGTSWMGNLVSRQKTIELLSNANDFLTAHESTMSASYQLQKAQIMNVQQEAIALSNQVYDIGLKMFERKSLVRESIAQRMDDLYDALWIFGISFILALAMAIMLFLSTMRRTDSLRASALQTQTQLSTALDELTTGDIERRAQNRFMAAASHDLRQPLHALGLYLNALKKHVPTDQGQIILANINRSTEALNQLLNSMLDLSKLDAGVVDVSWSDLNLNAVFDYLHQGFLPEANQRELGLDIQYSSLHVHSDRVLLERILANLVGNALNYTHEGMVSIRAIQEGDQICISVSDTGPGIPQNEQEAIFNEYYQLKNPERDRSKGLGLGLSIVKRLTRLLDIDLRLISAVGQGTTFEIRLPRANTELVSESPNPLKMTAITDCTILQGLSILVIDDEHDVRDGMRTLLVQHGCIVTVADSSEQACEYIICNDWVPQLIIADYRLRDDKTGDKAIEQVREEVNMDVPAMIITGDTSPVRLREATASGFPLLHKPVIAEELIAAITTLVGECK
ncbi:hybrid sensor histidine kinase/response regulator [Granulosicoccus antarcticus]|uniref:ATP-binding response regulator n=1 Tax=Granulosicoccus antarcticus TaxID=437505 RepID=UPI00146FBE7E|nr:hybrid sensor histidine kinase/response regulator [Granulosicoccus antarcticus]